MKAIFNTVFRYLKTTAVFRAFFRYYYVIFSQRIEPIDTNNYPNPKIYYFDFKSKEDESNIS